MPEDCFVKLLHIILDHQRGTLNRGLKLAIVMHEDPQELILHEHSDPALIDLQDSVRVQHFQERHHVLDYLPASIGCQPVVLSHLGHLVLVVDCFESPLVETFSMKLELVLDGL